MIQVVFDKINFYFSNWLWRSRRPFRFSPVYLLECLYILIFNLRKKQALKMRSNTPYQVPVWVVGNLSVGGEGKTPFIIGLIKELKNKGYRPGIITRGYGRKSKELVLINSFSEVSEVGDEALMMYDIFKGKVPIVVSSNRHLSILQLVNTLDCDLVISDDGLQNYSFHRDVEIIIMDANRKVGNGLCLPLGPLREPTSRLESVNAVIYRDHDSGFNVDIKGYFHADRPHEIIPIETLSGMDVTLVAGIGRPVRIIEKLTKLGVKVNHYPCQDHTKRYPEFKDDTLWVLTLKDWVKLKYKGLGQHCLVLDIEVDFSLTVKKLVSDLLKIDAQ